MKLIHQAKIVNEGQIFKGSVLIENDKIKKIFKENVPENILSNSEVIDAEGMYLLPGVIDDHVHFREPGLTHKATMATESRAAAAGGVTTWMDMPNCNPQTISIAAVEDKIRIAEETAVGNAMFYLGVTNDNIEDIVSGKMDLSKVCGLKLFLGSSTGNMLVNQKEKIEKLLSSTDKLIAVHAEDNDIINKNIEAIKADFKEELVPMYYHALIRNVEACYKASSMIVEMAHKYNSRLHLLHVSTAKELSLLDKKSATIDKLVTAETCPQYLWFDASQYDKFGARIKCNPAIKSSVNRDALIKALSMGIIDVIGTDHAPHLLSEKEGDCLHAVSGMPQIQYSLVAMLELAKQGKMTIEQVVERMSHAPATIFRIEKRGFIRKGYFADLVLVDRNKKTNVCSDNIFSLCGWSPYEGMEFSHKVVRTFCNGKEIFY